MDLSAYLGLLAKTRLKKFQIQNYWVILPWEISPRIWKSAFIFCFALASCGWPWTVSIRLTPAWSEQRLTPAASDWTYGRPQPLFATLICNNPVTIVKFIRTLLFCNSGYIAKQFLLSFNEIWKKMRTFCPDTIQPSRCRKDFIRLRS